MKKLDKIGEPKVKAGDMVHVNSEIGDFTPENQYEIIDVEDNKVGLFNNHNLYREMLISAIH